MTTHFALEGGTDLLPDESNGDIDHLCQRLAHKSFARLSAEEFRSILLQSDPLGLQDWSMFHASWQRLPMDGHMADQGRYRRRRYATLSSPASCPELRVEPPQPHYQSVTHNSVNGGVQRYFEPIEDGVLRGKTMTSVLSFGREVFGRLSPYSDWHIEVHQFRIEADGVSVALPTPEGRHRDGVSFAMMMLVDRVNVSGGVTTIWDLVEDRVLDEFTLASPLDVAFVNDERVRHSVTPLTPFDVEELAHRDVLVATFRYQSEPQRAVSDGPVADSWRP